MALAEPTVRERRLIDVLSKARSPMRVVVSERSLFGAGAFFAVTGLVTIVLGWIGTSRTVLVAGQIPYLVSGGLLGLAFVILGGFLYFGYWLATIVRDGATRMQVEEESMAELRAEIANLSATIAALNQPARRTTAKK